MNIKEPNFQIDVSKLTNMPVIKRIIIHHSGVDVDQSAKIIHDYHVNTNGWAAIGYHFLIRYDGAIEKGRPLNKMGAHVSGHNEDSIGICLTGNFSNTDLLKRPAQYNALIELVRYLLKDQPGLIIKKHNDYSNTQCPGYKFPWTKFLSDVSDNNIMEENQKLRDVIRATIAQLQKVLDNRS